MALANGVRFIWLDAHIGKDGECESLKRLFRTALDPAAAMPPDAIDSLIRALNENAAPILFADKPDDAIQLIKSNSDKKIIFISSGSLGKPIIPRISTDFPYVHSFYIFCALIERYVELSIEFRSCLQIFTTEMDLLVRLTRDISKDIIKQGEIYMQLNEPKDALKCFKSAETLNINANTADTLNDPYHEQLRILNGHNGSIGLIQQAENMMNSKQQSQPSNTSDSHELSNSASSSQNDDDIQTSHEESSN